MHVLANAERETVRTFGSRDITGHICDIEIIPKYFKFHKNLKITVNFKIQLQKLSYMFVKIKIIGQSPQKNYVMLQKMHFID